MMLYANQAVLTMKQKRGHAGAGAGGAGDAGDNAVVFKSCSDENERRKAML